MRLTDKHPVTMRVEPSVSYSGIINLWNGDSSQSVTGIHNNNSTKYARSIDWDVKDNFNVTSGCVELITQNSYIEVSAEL
jgi:hypothetical protein